MLFKALFSLRFFFAVPVLAMEKKRSHHEISKRDYPIVMFIDQKIQEGLTFPT